MFRINYLLLFSFILLYACSDENDTAPEQEIPEDVLEINHFIQDNMDLYYLWNSDMPDVDPDKQEDSEEYFYSLRYSSIDQWSFITDDYQALVEYFSGVRKEMGYSVRGFYATEAMDRVVAIVEYVEPGGPAERAGLKRGDMIVKINNSILDADNYEELFYSESLDITLGYVDQGEFVDLTPIINVNAEVIQVDPILENKIFYENGMKIGYLAYTSFIYEFNEDLQSVFANFKTEGIDELILDLRYNSGGSVASAKLLTEMICPSSCVGQVFLRTSYNDVLEREIKKQYPNEKFEDYFETNDNNLNLSRLYVLTTPGTASASEMVIYSLSPYMNVIQIGEQTHGKYYGSTTIYDEDEKHNWAIQPIIIRAENVDNSIDYSVGLNPDIEIYDNYSYELGTTDDVLTSIALDNILGTNRAREILKSKAKQEFIPSNQLDLMDNPLKYEMFINSK